MEEFKQYEHHGRKVWVREHLRGLHREFCLCCKCQEFKPERREQNCKIANSLYDICVQYGLCTPVFECPAFKSTVNTSQTDQDLPSSGQPGA